MAALIPVPTFFYLLAELIRFNSRVKLEANELNPDKSLKINEK
jgi:hypothetical protein